MRFKLVVMSFALLATQIALAQSNVKPTSCPTVEAFKNTGVSSVMRDQNGTWITLEWKNRFNTEHEWTFFVGDITADYQSEALAKGNAAISGLVYKYGPVDFDYEGKPKWGCLYQNPESGALAGVLTPALTPEINNISKLFRRK